MNDYNDTIVFIKLIVLFQEVTYNLNIIQFSTLYSLVINFYIFEVLYERHTSPLTLPLSCALTHLQHHKIVTPLSLFILALQFSKTQTRS